MKLGEELLNDDDVERGIEPSLVVLREATKLLVEVEEPACFVADAEAEFRVPPRGNSSVCGNVHACGSHHGGKAETID